MFPVHTGVSAEQVRENTAFDLLFDTDIETKWERSMAKLGIDFNKLSGDAGHA